MKHEYSLAHLTVLSLHAAGVVDVAARAGTEYVGICAIDAGDTRRSALRPRARPAR